MESRLQYTKSKGGVRVTDISYRVEDGTLVKESDSVTNSGITDYGIQVLVDLALDIHNTAELLIRRAPKDPEEIWMYENCLLHSISQAADADPQRVEPLLEYTRRVAEILVVKLRRLK